MQISRVDENTVALSQLDPFCCELLRQIPESARADDASVNERLYSSPTAGREPGFEEDWKRYVQPELRHIFQSALAVVEGDLEKLPRKDSLDEGAVHLPLNHLDAWLHTLNQARLALAARHGFTEREMERLDPSEGNARALALFQVHFYGVLMECFLREVEKE